MFSSPRSRPLRLECLEPRTLLSTFSPTTTADGYTNTLRAAVIAANTAQGSNTILLQAGIYDLNLEGRNEESAATGDLDIKNHLTISGAGKDLTMINAHKIDRVLHIFSGYTVTITGVTITQGAANVGSGSTPENLSGGGILNCGTLTLTNCRFSDNLAGNDSSGQTHPGGGALFTSALTTVTNCSFENNKAGAAGSSIFGGGAILRNGTYSLAITGSTFSGNQACSGGAITDLGSSDGTTLTNCIFSGNTATWGGGAFVSESATASVSNCTFTNNSAQFDGGAIFRSADLTVTNSTFANNVSQRGGAISCYGSNGTITNCTFSGNSAQTGGAVSGTGTITNSTFNNNSASSYGGGILLDGYITLNIHNCTLSGNTASYGGGISAGRYANSVNLKNTIVAGNSATTSGPDLFSGSGLGSSAFNSQGNNLIGKGDGSSGLTNGVNGDQVGSVASPLDPKLGPLRNNGGPTQTMALLAGSSAIDAGNNNGAPVTDQRGYTRILDGNGDGTATIDISAYEYDPGPIIGTVVVAEAAPQNGILDTADALVITWGITGLAAISQTLTVDGAPVAPIYGPYGAYYASSSFGPLTAGNHTFVIHAIDSQGVSSDYNGSFTVNTPQSAAAQTIGAFAAGFWYRDVNHSGAWDAADGYPQAFGWNGATPVTGDWNADGKTEIGVYADGAWWLDTNGNGEYDINDSFFYFGWAGALPAVGDWNADGRSDVGVYNQGGWFRDINGNRQWDTSDQNAIAFLGWNGAAPVPGDWNGDGRTDMAVYCQGAWFRDLNGNGQWDSPDQTGIAFYGWAGPAPVVGDWNGDGRSEMGVYNQGVWFRDINGNSQLAIAYLGWSGALPVVGKWIGSGSGWAAPLSAMGATAGLLSSAEAKPVSASQRADLLAAVMCEFGHTRHAGCTGTDDLTDDVLDYPTYLR